MSTLRAWFARLGGLFGKERRDRELDAEMESHLQMHIEDNLHAGMAPEEARRQAMLKLGGVEQTKESYRDRRGLPWLDTLLQDVRFGARMLRKNRGFTAVAVLTLALGIGANTSIFSLIDAVLLRSLPVENPKQLVLLRWQARHAPNVHGYMNSGDCPESVGPRVANPNGCSFSEPLFRDMAKANAFSDIAGFAYAGRLNLGGNGHASVVDGEVVSGDFFRTMGLNAAVGRLLNATDDVPSAAPVAVLNYGYWQSAFGGSRDVIGRTIELNSVPFTIVGVAESRFTGITPGTQYQVWLPLSDAQRISDAGRWQNRQADVGFWWLTIVGRLKPGTPLAQAQAATSAFFHNEMLHGSTPLFNGASGPAAAPEPHGAPAMEGFRTSEPAGEPKRLSAAADDPEIALVPAQAGLVGEKGRYSDPLYVLMLTVGIILLIACANVAGLMLARGAARQKEMAVRLALGAGRARIVRQLLTESLMLSTFGGALGILFAYWGAHAITSFVSTNQTRPLGFATGVDLRVLGFTAAVALLAGILFGIVPALRSTRVDLTPALKEHDGRSPSRGQAGGRWFSIGNALVVAQVALAIVVLVGAGLLIRTLSNLRGVNVGFDSNNILIFEVDPTLVGYKGPQLASFYRDLQDRLAEIPGVSSASYSMMPLLSNGLMVAGFHWPGAPQDQESEADILWVGPHFFETLRIPFLGGRGFNDSDFELPAPKSGAGPTSAPTPVIVNQAFIEKYLGKENPLGKQFGESAGGANGPANPGYEIIGVVRDAKYSDLRRQIHATMYTPQRFGGVSFELRTAADPQAILPAIRNVVAQVDANLPLFNVTTESEQIDRLLFQERLIARLSGLFGALALGLACIGLYGLLSYEVSRRTREIGIRMALGAQPGSVLKLVLQEGIVLAIAGVAVGIGAALGVTRYLTSMLYDVHANDPVTIIAVGVLLVLVALAACWIPARRATRVDPMVALRYE